MSQDKARTYAKVMVDFFEGATEAETKKRAKRLKEVLQKRGDMKRVSSVLQEFQKAWKERKGKIATVVSAQSLEDATRKEMRQSLAKKRFVLEERVDPGVIGGVALYLGNDFVIDSTLQGKLQRFAKFLQHG